MLREKSKVATSKPNGRVVCCVARIAYKYSEIVIVVMRTADITTVE